MPEDLDRDLLAIQEARDLVKQAQVALAWACGGGAWHVARS